MSSEIDTSPFSGCLDNNFTPQAQESKSEKNCRRHFTKYFFEIFLGLKSGDRNELNAGSQAQKFASVVY